MIMGRFTALSVSIGMVAVFAQYGCVGQADAASEITAQPNSPSGGPVYNAWPAPAGDYADIDGKQVWQYVEEQAAISRNYRDNVNPQYWGRIAGTSADAESAQWLLEAYQELGL